MKNKTNRYYIHAGWLVILFLLIAFPVALYELYDLWQNPHMGDHRSKALLLTIVTMVPVAVALEGRGYVLSEGYFTVTWFGIPVNKTSWDQVAQVIYVKRDWKKNYRGVTWGNREMICVSIKPAQPFPYKKNELLRKHWWRNFLLVWNVRFLNPQTKGKAHLQAFQKYWGEVEIREYDR